MKSRNHFYIIPDWDQGTKISREDKKFKVIDKDTGDTVAIYYLTAIKSWAMDNDISTELSAGEIVYKYHKFASQYESSW